MIFIGETVIKKTTKGNGTSKSDEYLSDSQQKKLLKFVKNQADQARQNGATRAVVDELIVMMLLDTGLRPKEFCNLRIQDVFLNNGESTLSISGANGDSARHIHISSETTDHLQRFIKLYRKNANPDEPLLISERGNPFTYMSLYSKIKKIGQKAGLGKLHPYMLRRTFMVELYNTEHDLRYVQQQAGHASPKTTAIYVKTTLGHKRNISAKNAAAITYVSTISNIPRTKKKTVTCHACDKPIANDKGTKIGSGQTLCCECINYFHS